MKLRSLIILVSSAILATTAHAQSDWKATKAQMDKASAAFTHATANFRWETYERVVRETTVQTGSIYFERVNKATEMGASVSYEDSKAKPQIMQYQNGVLKLYKPEDKQVTLLKAGPNQTQYEGFLTLGFGGSGTDLEKIWDVKDVQSEMLKDGDKVIKTEMLELTPKDPALKKTFTKVTIWVDLTRGVSLKQTFLAPSGDYKTSYFFNIKTTGSINRDPFKIPADVPVSSH